MRSTGRVCPALSHAQFLQQLPSLSITGADDADAASPGRREGREDVELDARVIEDAVGIGEPESQDKSGPFTDIGCRMDEEPLERRPHRFDGGRRLARVDDASVPLKLPPEPQAPVATGACRCRARTRTTSVLRP